MQKVWDPRFRAMAVGVCAVLWLSGCKNEPPPVPPPPFPSSPQWAEENPQLANDNTPVLMGFTRNATHVHIFQTPDCTGEVFKAIQLSAPRFTFTLQAPDDSITLLSAVALNGTTGQESSCSAVFTYTEDSTAPAPPVLTGSTPASPGNSLTPRVSGTVEPGAKVHLYTDSGCTTGSGLDATADAEGRFEASASLDAIRTSVFLYAAATDPAGNRSACSSGVQYILDRLPPSPPFISDISPQPPANDNAPRIRGTAEPGMRVSVRYSSGFSCTGAELGSGLVAADGTFEATLRVADNSSQQFAAVAIDPAGNVSECSFSRYYTEDSTPPSPPTLTVGSPPSPSAVLTPIFNGRTDSNSTVLLYASEDCSGAPDAMAPASGSSFTLSARQVPLNVVTRFSLAARDMAGNLSGCTGPVTYRHDGIAPDATAAIVVDGPGADLQFQTHTIMEAHWSGFTDELGVTAYAFAVGKAPGCGTGSIVSDWITATSPQIRVANLNLQDGVYYQCVRARDTAANLSAIASSNGVRVDTLPPTVASHVPGTGQTDVSIRSGVTVTFSEPMNPATVPTRFTLSANGAAVAGTVSCSSEAVCTFTSDAPLPYQETITATVAAGVLDSVGRPLAASYTFSFMTQGRRWAPEPTPLHDVRPGMSPEVGLDQQGNALALWVQRNAQGLWRVYASRYTAGTTWTLARMIDANVAGSAGGLSLGSNATGQALALWELQNGTGADLFSAEYVPGTGWSTPQPVEARPEAVSQPQVAVDAQGRGIAVWRQSDGTGESLWAAHHVPGQGWGTPRLLETEPGTVSAHALATDASGTAVVAWLQADTAGTRVMTSRYTPGTGWTAPVMLTANAEGPTVAAGLGTDGSAVVLFRVLEAVGNTLHHRLSASRWAPGTGWVAPVLVPAASGPVEEDFAVAVGFQGTALAVWTQIDGTPTLYTSRFTPAGGWPTHQKAHDSSSRPSVAVDAEGNFHLAWIYNSLGSDLVFTARYPESASVLGPARALEGLHGATSKRPRLMSNAAGGAVAIWARDNGTGVSGNLVYANLFE